MKAIVLLAPGYEEIEALCVVDVLRRANCSVDLVHVFDEKVVESASGTKITADYSIDEVQDDFDLIVTPGGLPGAEHLRDSAAVRSLLQKSQNKKWIASICASPIALDRAGILAGKRYTCYPGFEKNITEGTYSNESVVVDDQLITGKGPAKALLFAFAILEHVMGEKVAQKVKDEMLYTH